MQQPSLNSAINTMSNATVSAINNNCRDVFEYLLVVQTDGDLKQQVKEERRAFYNRYDAGVTEASEPGITVMRFLAMEDMEATISRWVQRICCQQESFIVTLNNFSGYPPNNIHIRVPYTQAFQRLGTALKVIDNYVKSYGLPAARISNHPHLTIARRIPESIYIKALFDYAQRDFYSSFIVQELNLLKRKHQFEAPKKINVFGLLPGMAATAYNEPLITF